MSFASAKRIPQVVLFGIGNHHPSLHNTRHNVGAIILQQYLSHLKSQFPNLDCVDSGKNAFKIQNLTVNENMLTEYKERIIFRLKKKFQIENPGLEMPEAILEEQLEGKLNHYCPQPVVDLHILFPSTAMNVSGNVIRNYCDLHHIYYKRKDRVLILYDDLDLPFGSFKLKERSGDAGHNGIKDIERRLGTNKFFRLKIGIHPPERSSNISGRDFVLSKFNYEEMKTIQGELFTKIHESCLSCFPHFSIEDIMKRTNTF